MVIVRCVVVTVRFVGGDRCVVVIVRCMVTMRCVGGDSEVCGGDSEVMV